MDGKRLRCRGRSGVKVPHTVSVWWTEIGLKPGSICTSNSERQTERTRRYYHLETQHDAHGFVYDMACCRG